MTQQATIWPLAWVQRQELAGTDNTGRVFLHVHVVSGKRHIRQESWYMQEISHIMQPTGHFDILQSGKPLAV